MTSPLVTRLISILLICGFAGFLATRQHLPATFTATAQPSRAPFSEEQLVNYMRQQTVRINGRIGKEFVGGSGMVINASKGLILTNDHVVHGTTDIVVTVDDTRKVNATIIGESPCDDLAVLRLAHPTSGMKNVTFGSISSVQAGEHVSAFGYPGGINGKQATSLVVTTGTVSSPHLIDTIIDAAAPEYPSLIQHQAPVNHGNSGGPLVDDYGRVIGINTLSNSGGEGNYQGQYYAIATDRIAQVLPIIVHGNSLANPGWDAVPVAELIGLDPNRSQATKLRTLFAAHHLSNSVALNSVYAHSAAQTAGLTGNDVISTINGHAVTTVAGICRALYPVRSGQHILITGDSINNGDFLPFRAHLQLPVVTAPAATATQPPLPTAQITSSTPRR